MRTVYLWLLVCWLSISCTHEPVGVCPENPHYFFYQDKPTVFITSDHHYGAVIDMDFDYVKYLDYLHSFGMNLTRIYPGGMFEPPDKYQKGSPLGPKQGRQLLPWKKSTVPGANPFLARPGEPSYKYDLTSWNPAYFERLKDYVKQAGKRGIVVEVAFFNGMYADCWPLMAMYHTNNIQGVGKYESDSCGLFTMATSQNLDVIKFQKTYIQKITQELNEFDNLIFDICDEPSLQGLPDGNIIINPDSLIIPWILAMKDAFLEAESQLPVKHILGQTVQNLSPDHSRESWCQWLPTEYVSPAMRALQLDYKTNKPIMDVESNFYGISLTKNPYNTNAVRVEGWWFMLSGGAGCINLNGELHRGQEEGGQATQMQIAPQKRILKQFMDHLDLAHMRTYDDVHENSSNVQIVGLCSPGMQYAFYLFHGQPENEWGSHFTVLQGPFADTLILDSIAAGHYTLEWLDPASGSVKLKEEKRINGGKQIWMVPEYSLDIALLAEKN